MKTIYTSLGLIAFILFISASSVNASEKDCSKDSRYPLITTSELTKVVEDKTAFIIDVNSKESFEKNHVPGAIHFAASKKDLANLLPKDKSSMVVSYCGGPMCGAWKKAAEKACKMGYTNIHHYKDGISGWVAKK